MREWLYFSKVLEYLFVKIMMGSDASDEITEKTGLLLKQLTHDDVLAVSFVGQIFTDRILEDECCDACAPIEKYDAVLAALEPWLELNGSSLAIN